MVTMVTVHRLDQVGSRRQRRHLNEATLPSNTMTLEWVSARVQDVGKNFTEQSLIKIFWHFMDHHKKGVLSNV